LIINLFYGENIEETYVKTAGSIYKKIEDGFFDGMDEIHGTKVGPLSVGRNHRKDHRKTLML